MIFNFEELYQQMLAKALAHYYEAKLLLLDVTEFSIKVSTWNNCFLFAYKFLIAISSVVCLVTDSEQMWGLQQRYGKISKIEICNQDLLSIIGKTFRN